MGKIIGLTYDLKTDYPLKENDPPDANAEFDFPQTIDLITQAIESLGHQVRRIGSVSSLLRNIEHLDVDIVFNISEGLTGRNRESQVPVILEMKGIPFVGSDGLTLALTLDKLMAKKIFLAENIPTPKYIEVKQPHSLVNSNHFNFPLIVKPRFEGSSRGIDLNARVGSLEELIKRTDFIINTYKQPALVEEFIKGKDLEDKIRDLALRAYRAVECRDFGRVDFRVDQQDNPYVLEINPLPCLASDDVFMLIPKVMNIGYPEMIGRILESAFKRYSL